MLEISASVNKIPFKLNDGDTSVELVATQFNIADSQRLYDLQKDFFDEEGNFIPENLNKLTISRVITSVKNDAGGYFWQSIDAFTSKEYPQEMLNLLSAEVEKLNPVMTDKIDAKKK